MFKKSGVYGLIILVFLLSACQPDDDITTNNDEIEVPEEISGLGDLCAFNSEDNNCYTFCTKNDENSKKCQQYCKEHPENELCSEVTKWLLKEEQAVTTEKETNTEELKAEPLDPRYTPAKDYTKTVIQEEPLILNGNQELLIEDTHYIVKNDIILKDNAKLIIKNSFLDQQKEYSGEYYLEAFDNSQVVLEDIELRNECTGGMGWNFFDKSSFIAEGVQQKDCNIWVLTTASASSHIKEWDWFGGTTCDDASLIVENSKDLEIELCNTQDIDIEVKLPSVIDEYEFSARTIQGIKNSIILRNVTLDGWGPGAYYGTGVTVVDSHAATISFGLTSDFTGRTVMLDNLGKKHYNDTIWKFDEGYIRIVNTTMYGWETGVWGKNNKLIIRNSDFTGPTFNGGNSKVVVENSTFEWARAFETVQVEISDSQIKKEINAHDNGKITIQNSELIGVQQGDNFYPVRVVATGNGTVELINTPFNNAILVEEDNGQIIIK